MFNLKLLKFWGQADPTEEMLKTHLAIDRYGSFQLTEAVRPSYALAVTPRQGYRREVFRQGGRAIKVLMAAASREVLLELFLALLDPLGSEVDVALKTSHRRSRRQDGHDDLYRDGIDLPVLKSLAYEFEDLLLNDGCTGLAAFNEKIPAEVQLDEHKLLAIFAADQAPYEALLQAFGVYRDDKIRFITEAEHMHSSSEEYRQRFLELVTRLGAEE